jgi:hypothetical protein
MELKEEENTKKIVQEVAKKLSSGAKFDIQQLCPELQLQHNHTNLLPMTQTTLLQLPYYDKVIIPVEPIASENDFDKYYGLSARDLIELHRKGRTAFILAKYPANYANLSYLDPILELCPPSITRFDAFLALIGSQLPDAELDGWQTIARNSVKKSELAVMRKAHDILDGDLTGRDTQFSPDHIATSFLVLSLMGYHEPARRWLELKNPAERYFVVNAFRKILCDLYFYSLDGTWSLSEQNLTALTEVGIRLNRPERFPTDVGRMLIKELRLVQIVDCGIERIIDVCSETGQARKALRELDSAVQMKQVEKSLDRAAALKEVWEETNTKILEMAACSRSAVLITPLILGIAGGAIGSFGGLPGMVGGIVGGGIASLPIIAPSSRFIAKINRPNHIIAVYNLKKTLKEKT